jgi:hypothetical protein
MIRTSRTALTAAFLLSAAALVAACGGSTALTTPGAPTATPAAPTTSAGTPAATPAGGETTEPSLGALPSFDIGQLASGLENHDSYKASLSIGGTESYSTTVVTKPVVSRDIVLKDGTHIVVVGDEAWMGQAGSPLASVPTALATQLYAAFDPTVLFKSFSGPEWAASSVDKGTEQKNGQNTHHYHIDSTTAAGGFSGIPAGASIDVWVADEGYLVSLVATGFGQDLDIEVTNIDDPANKVEKPS